MTLTPLLHRLLPFLPIALAACSGLDTGNAEVARVELALSAGPSAPVDSSGTELPIATAFTQVRHVELYLPAGTECTDLPDLSATDGDHTVVCDGDKIRARGPWRVDLLSRQATPPLPTVPVVAGTYRRVDVRLEKDALGVTLSLTGTLPLGGVPTPYALDLDFEENVRFEGRAITASPDAVARAVLALDPSSWFASLPIVACAESGAFEIDDGVVEMDDGGGACEDIEDIVRAALVGSGSLERDDGEED